MKFKNWNRNASVTTGGKEYFYTRLAGSISRTKYTAAWCRINQEWHLTQEVMGTGERRVIAVAENAKSLIHFFEMEYNNV